MSINIYRPAKEEKLCSEENKVQAFTWTRVSVTCVDKNGVNIVNVACLVMIFVLCFDQQS